MLLKVTWIQRSPSVEMHANMFKTVNMATVLLCAYFLNIVGANESSDELSQNYEQLLKSGNFSDVRLVVGKERKEFRLHKCILYARCPVIGEMFEAEKSPENQLLIPDESPEVFEQLIEHLYTGKVKNIKQNVKNLLILADKYKVNSLKTRCTEELMYNLATQSVASTLVFADFYNVTQLKSRCLYFITENSRAVMASEDWKQIKDRPDLLLELFDNMSRNCPSTNLYFEKKYGRLWR